MIMFLPFLSISLRARRSTIFSECIITIFFHKMRDFPLLNTLKLSHGNLIQLYRDQNCQLASLLVTLRVRIVSNQNSAKCWYWHCPGRRSEEDWYCWWQCWSYRSLFTLGSTHYHHQPRHYYYSQEKINILYWKAWKHSVVTGHQTPLCINRFSIKILFLFWKYFCYNWDYLYSILHRQFYCG